MKKKMPDWGTRTFVMGVINLTPDSFSGDGLLAEKESVEQAIHQAKYFAQNGVDILDIGAESSRPGSTPLDADAELQRLLPSLEAILKENLDIIISIDTYKSIVAEKTLKLGADWINDIWALRKDPNLAEVVAAYDAGLILMHNRSEHNQIIKKEGLGSSYSSVQYEDLIADIQYELQSSIQTAINADVHCSKIILDPGLGFGKSIPQNFTILRNLKMFKTMGYPLLIGPSRKSFIGYTLDLAPHERVEGTAAAVAIGIANGADIVRVHDVPEMVRVARIADAIVRQ